MKKLFSIGVIIFILVFFTYYISTNINDFASLRLGNSQLLIPLFIIAILNLILYGFANKIVLEPFKINLEFKEWFGLISITNFYNAITPFRGGIFARAFYLKKKYSLSYTRFVTSWFGAYTLILMITSFIGLIGLIPLYVYKTNFNPLIFFIFLMFFIPTFFVLFFAPTFKKKGNKLYDIFVEMADSWNSVKGNKRIVLFFVVNTLITLSLNVYFTLICYKFFGITLNISQSLLLVVIGSLSFVAQITPGNLGVSEIINVFVGLTIGITPAQAIATSILSRIINLIVVSILGSYYTYVLLRESPIEFLEESKSKPKNS